MQVNYDMRTSVKIVHYDDIMCREGVVRLT